MESEDYNNTTESGLCRLEKRLKYDGEYEEHEEGEGEEEGGEGEREEGEEYRMKRNDQNLERFNFGKIYSTDFAVFSDKKNQSNDSDKCSADTEIQNSENCSDKCGNHIMMLQCLQSPNKKDRMRTEEKGKKEGENEKEKRGIGMKENNIDEDSTGKILTGKNSLGINSRFYGSCESKEKGTDGEIDDDSDDDNNNNNNNNNNDNKQSFSPARTRLSTVHLAGSTGTGYTVKAGTVSITNAGSSCISACIDEIDNYYYEENPEQKRIEMKKLKEAHHPYVLQENILDEKVCAEILGRAGTVAGRESVGRFSVQSPPRGAGISGTGTGYGEGMGDDDDNIEWIGASDISYNDDNNNENNNNNNKKENENKNNKESIEDVEKEKEKENENEWMRIKLNTKMQSMNNNRDKNNICENNENDNDIECSTENDCLVLNNNTDNDESNNVTEDNDNDNFEFNGEGCSFGRSVTHCFKN